MHAIVEDVEGEGSRDDSVRCRVRKDGVGEVGEGELKGEEEHRRHDESKSVLNETRSKARRRVSFDFDEQLIDEEKERSSDSPSARNGELRAR